MTKPECIENKEVYKGKILTFFKKKMKFANGNTSDWDFVHHNGAAAIVAVDNDGKLFLVKQYRPGCDRFTLEIPAGCLNPGEDRKTAAMRELEEEIGYHCDDGPMQYRQSVHHRLRERYSGRSSYLRLHYPESSQSG